VPQQTSLINVILLAAGGFFMFVCMDSMAKYLGTVMPITQAIWGRFFFHLISLIIFFLIFKPKVNLKKNFKVQIIRSILMVTATSFMFYSLQKFDLVDIYVVFFTAPLIVSLLSAYFLKDILTPKGILLMLLSFGSIIYSLGPSMKIFSIDLIFPNNYSIFLIYERNQALGSGHTDKINITIGYLPGKNTNYAFKIVGSENLMSKFELRKIWMITILN